MDFTHLGFSHERAFPLADHFHLLPRVDTAPTHVLAGPPSRPPLQEETPDQYLQIIPTPAATEIGPSLNAGQFIKGNSRVVVAFIISGSVLVAGIVGSGRKKE